MLWIAPALLAALGFVGLVMAEPGTSKGSAGAAAFQPAPGDRGREGPGGRGGRGGRRDGGGPGGGARGGPGAPVEPGRIAQRALDELNLSGTKKEKAEAVVKAYQENLSTVRALARADLLLKMQDIVSADEFKKFKEAADRRPGPGPGGFGGRGRQGGRPGLTVDQIVERIMSFDKNKDGKITKDELPERMQGLIAKGDTNKDGALDKEEIKKLAIDLARDGNFRQFDYRGGGRGPGEFGRGGRGGFGGGFPPAGPPIPGANFQRAVDELKLDGTKKEKADAAVKALQDNVKKVSALARADLLLKMKDILSEDELGKFKNALDRPPGSGRRGGQGGSSTPADAGTGNQELQKKIDQLQKELDELKRQIRR
jgi:hypothetical protein